MSMYIYKHIKNKDNFPLSNNCLTMHVIYEVTITSDLPKKYIGLCESTFKKRFASHTSCKNNTSLSVELLNIKENNGTPNVTWRIIRKAKAYTSRSIVLCV